MKASISTSVRREGDLKLIRHAEFENFESAMPTVPIPLKVDSLIDENENWRNALSTFGIPAVASDEIFSDVGHWTLEAQKCAGKVENLRELVNLQHHQLDVLAAKDSTVRGHPQVHENKAQEPESPDRTINIESSEVFPQKVRRHKVHQKDRQKSLSPSTFQEWREFYRNAYRGQS
jgi:hypothetical protein